MRTEQRKVKEVAEEYKSMGYEVLLKPTVEQLPKELHGHSPDLVAIKGKERIFVDVKSRSDLTKSDELIELSKNLEGNENWRVELIVVNPAKSKSKSGQIKNVISWEEIQGKAKEASELISHGHQEAASILAWIAVEGAMRQIAQSEKIASHTDSTSELIKSLAIYGLITRNDYKNIEQIHQARNQLVHGFLPEKQDSLMAKKILRILPKLEKERRIEQ